MNYSKLFFVLISVVLVFFISVFLIKNREVRAEGSDWFVAPTASGGNDSNNCETVSTPCATVKEALSKAGLDGDSDPTIHIAEGTIDDYDIEIYGGEFFDSVAILGAGMTSTYIDAGELGRVFDISGAEVSIEVSISNLSMYNGYLESGNGAGVINEEASVSLESVGIYNCSTGLNGGGVAAVNSDQMLINNSRIYSNNASDNGGGIFTEGEDVNLEITNSEISDNEAGYTGGGIFNESGELSAKNCTISNNTAESESEGGGGVANGFGSVRYESCTIIENSPSNIQENYYDTTTLFNTIVANPVLGDNCVIWSGSVESEGGNIATDDSCLLDQESDQEEIEFVSGTHYGALANNGGITQTHALIEGSPAIDTGYPECTSTACATTDQRGTSRPQGPEELEEDRKWDVGAYEFAVEHEEETQPEEEPSSPSTPTTTTTPSTDSTAQTTTTEEPKVTRLAETGLDEKTYILMFFIVTIIAMGTFLYFGKNQNI